MSKKKNQRVELMMRIIVIMIVIAALLPEVMVISYDKTSSRCSSCCGFSFKSLLFFKLNKHFDTSFAENEPGGSRYERYQQYDMRQQKK